MKPSLLKISGLNSFSQTETIDFSKLTERGLFGIFGPTGSGKSTILDAITLALYGDVARKTKSYINSECDKTNIYFEFFSGYGTNRKKYIIDRTIKRTKTGTQTANITLEIYSEDCEFKENIIEKRSSVEKELIDNIVKLNFEDFIRTVVLPQGKFSEFLTLTGAERNNMLERILGLEEYGQSLTDKINIRKTETNSEIDKLEGERFRYSESSKEKITELEKIKEAILIEEKALKTELEKLENDYKKYSIVFELQEELQKYKDKEKKLLDDKAKMIEIEKKIVMARNALHIAPHVDTFDKDVKDRQENTIHLRRITKELDDLVVNLEIIAKDYNNAYEAKEKNYESLIEKKSKLDTAIELELDNFKNKESLEDETKYHNQISETIKEKSIRLKQISQQKESLERKIIIIEDELKKNVIPSNYRKILIDGLDIEKSFKTTQRDLKDKSEELLKCTERIENGKQKIDKLKSSEDSLKTELKKQKRSYIYLSKILLAKELFVKQIMDDIEEEREKSLANSLAKYLEKGNPCPVCGSIEHPDIAQSVDQTVLSEKNILKEELENDIKILNQELILIQSLFKANKLSLSFDIESRELNDNKESENNKENLQKMKSSKFAEISKTLKTTLEYLNSNKIDLDKKDVEYSILLENIIENSNKIEIEILELKKNFNELDEKYTNIKIQLNTKNIKAKYDKVSILEEQIEQLNKELIDYREKLKNIALSKDKLEKEIQEDKVSFEKLSFSIENKKAHIEKNEKEITKVTKGEKPSELKDNVDSELRELIKNEKQLHENLERLKNKNTILIEQKLTAINIDTKLNNKIEKNQYKIDSLLDEYKFTSIESVRGSYLEKESVSELETQLNQYRSERENNKSNIGRIKKILGDESTTVFELQKLKTEKTEKANRQQILLEEKGSLLEKLLEMNKNIDRVKTIDKKIKKLTVKKDSLDEIGKMTKGKRFVEFVARNHLKYIAKVATEKLKDITRGRFGLVLNSDSVFEIVDNYNGGITRDASSLSGGETFLTSLALALALSTKIQLKGNTSMEFFFLDEGFGTLDVETLDTAMTALEKLYTDNLSVGIISHVEEIKNRVPIKLMVSSPVPGVKGSEVNIQRT